MLVKLPEFPRVMEGMPPLTLTEKDILLLLADGLNVAEIAKDRHITLTTSRCHVKHILEKLGVNSQSKAIVLYYKNLMR